MSVQPKEPSEAKRQEQIARLNRSDHRIEHLYRRILHLMEHVIAAMSIVVLVAALCLEVVNMFTTEGYFADIETFLHNILTIVVGLEFVRMLVDTTPASILEVLTVAITRHVILTHDDPLSNVACIACIAGLFAIRRFLVRPTELKEELSEIE